MASYLIVVESSNSFSSVHCTLVLLRTRILVACPFANAEHSHSLPSPGMILGNNLFKNRTSP